MSSGTNTKSISCIFFLPPLLSWVFDDCVWRMVLFAKAASKGRANGIFATGSHTNRWTVVSIYTEFKFAILTIQAGIQSSEVGNSFQILVGRFVLVLETAFVPFSARSPQVMVVA